jgi:hypothetical protein
MATTTQPSTITPDRNLPSPDQNQVDPEIDLAERRKTYRWFVRSAFLFAAHVVVVLLVLGYIFSDGMG